MSNRKSEDEHNDEREPSHKKLKTIDRKMETPLIPKPVYKDMENNRAYPQLPMYHPPPYYPAMYTMPLPMVSNYPSPMMHPITEPMPYPYYHYPMQAPAAVQPLTGEKNSDSNYDIRFNVAEQPDEYQVCNYNIQPTLTIQFEKAPKEDCIVKIELVENSTKQIIEKAFKAADVHPVHANSETISCNGLKLARINFIKEQMATTTNLNIKDMQFHIQLSIKNQVVTTKPFKIVSSFAQLPKKLQTKRYARGNKQNL